jgi:hypothetical protein
MKNKVKLKESAFLDWYFSDQEDIDTFGRNMIFELRTTGFVKETVQDLLDRCGYIPGHISENPDDDNEYNPEDVELISEREPKHCYKCGHKYNNIYNFCSNCLTLK